MMRRNALLALAFLTVLATSAPAFAANSSSEPETPDMAEETKLYNQGTKQLKKGNWSEAAESLRGALELKEDFPEAHNNLGYALRKMGEEHYEEALEHYDRALELAPDLAEAHHYRGVLHVLMGDMKAALEDHTLLVDSNPKLADQLEAVIQGGADAAAKGDGGIAGTW